VTRASLAEEALDSMEKATTDVKFSVGIAAFA
jgi:hypothetical protein